MPAKGCTAVPESMFLTLPLALVLSLPISLSPSSSTLPAVPSVCVFCAPFASVPGAVPAAGISRPSCGAEQRERDDFRGSLAGRSTHTIIANQDVAVNTYGTM